MEHFHVVIANAHLPNADVWREFLEIAVDPDQGDSQLRVVGLSPRMQEEHRTLNAIVQIVPESRDSTAGSAGCQLFMRAEQAAHTRSSVSLDSSEDRFGRPRAVLDWVPTSVDWTSVVRSTNLVANSLRSAFGVDRRGPHMRGLPVAVAASRAGHVAPSDVGQSSHGHTANARRRCAGRR
jgi:hypothetical protein